MGRSKHMDVEEIKKVIPHREPALLINEIVVLDVGKEIRGIFRADPKCAIFKGHFPGNPVVPGAMLIEAMAQVSSILILMEEQFEGKTPYFAGINDLRFLCKAEPSDTLEIFSRIYLRNTPKAIIRCRTGVAHGLTDIAKGEVVIAVR